MRSKHVALLAVTFGLLASRSASAAVHVLHSSMAGDQENPATGSTGTGECTVTVDDVSNLVSANCTFSGLSVAASNAHIHGLGAFNSAPAPVILPFTFTADISGTASGSATLTPALVAGILAGQAYTNIHSANFPSGEIRGQIGDFAINAPTATAYVINGGNNPPLTVIRGKTYVFQADSTGHPFHITTAPGLPPADFNTGVTGNGTAFGTVTFTVPLTAPNQLFYQCGVHTAMTGTISVIRDVPAIGTVAAVVLCSLLLAVALVALRRRLRGPTTA